MGEQKIERRKLGLSTDSGLSRGSAAKPTSSKPGGASGHYLGCLFAWEVAAAAAAAAAKAVDLEGSR